MPSLQGLLNELIGEPWELSGPSPPGFFANQLGNVEIGRRDVGFRKSGKFLAVVLCCFVQVSNQFICFIDVEFFLELL